MAAASYIYRTLTKDQIDDKILAECASLFSKNYGIWAPDAPKPLKPGKRVMMNAGKLRQQCISDAEHTVLAVCTLDGVLIGHAFAVVWQTDGGSLICWVTQLVVEQSHRQKGVATALIQTLPGENFGEVDLFGIASSHPAACLSLLKRTKALDLDFIRNQGPTVLASATVDYLKTGQLRGSLFDPKDASGAVSTIFTNFYVDHAEPLSVLGDVISKHGKWPLGSLLDGHEFLVIARAS
ncbi:hypothetical protein QCA50_005537 [Cerrena zonata]|uniref:N-acetyltransferase domain-containing protein n=1 Tax=Cerrena zonata TaxID=2478898 RepID=A0AAW0GGQ7_9APHY